MAPGRILIALVILCGMTVLVRPLPMLHRGTMVEGNAETVAAIEMRRVDPIVSADRSAKLRTWLQNRTSALAGTRTKNACRCPTCERTFPSKKEYEEHAMAMIILRHHNMSVNSSSCPICGRGGFRDVGSQKLEEHMLNHMEYRPHICDICNKSFRYLPNYHAHMASVHKNNKSKNAATQRNNNIFSASSISTSMYIHKQIDPFDCKFKGCNQTFRSRNGLLHHQKDMHDGGKKKRYECMYCDKSFRDEQYLNVHIKGHKGSNPFRCNECNETFRYQNVYKAHAIQKHGQSPFQCEVCSQLFNYRSNFIKHKKRYHMSGKKDRMYRCSVCEYGCMSSADLKRHTRKHTGEQPYECKLCGQRFADSSNCNKHKNAHLNLRPFLCRECNMSFSQKISFKNHMMIHSGTRPFPCTRCEKAFHQIGNLRTHMRIHTGEKPYICTVKGCNQRFLYVRSMDRHIRLRHGGIRKEDASRFHVNLCPVCGKNFREREALEVHMFLHNLTGDPPYKCPFCGPFRTFESKRSIISHFRIHCNLYK